MIDVAERLPLLHALVGSEVGISDWKAYDQEAIDAHAALAGDRGAIHNDPTQAAAISPFGGTIVQGSLLMATLPEFLRSVGLPQERVAFRLSYGYDRVRIVSPVPTGIRCRGRFDLHDLKAKGDGAALATIGATIEIEGEERPALVADMLVYFVLEPQE